MPQRLLRGVAVSPGVAVGPALVVRWEVPPVPERTVPREEVARELGRRSVGFELNPAYHKISESRPGVGLPDILSWTEESHARTVEDILGPSDGGHILPPETVTPRPRLPVVTLDAWE